MAIDFLIFVLLLISLSINLLALGAFWVTPALRTTANRFVINLLVVNIIGSLILAPTLFLSSSLSSWRQSSDYDDHTAGQLIGSLDKSQFSQDLIHDSIIRNDAEIQSRSFGNSNSETAKNSIIVQDIKVVVNGTERTEKHSECTGNECKTFIIETDDQKDKSVITEIDEKDNIPIDMLTEQGSNDRVEKIYPKHKLPYRCWSIDLAAALGALSVLLVVGDTWMAVTDPLRYHTRISGLKSWLLIATIWFFGILFGVLSALRDHAFSMHDHEITEETIEYKDTIRTADNRLFDEKIISHQYHDHLASIQPNDLYNMIYSCFYFIVIILLPFGFVCGMYWRIFSEARENGLRMRQNGSSPLLQSALNLSAHQNQLQQQKNAQYNKEHRDSSDNSTTGLTMKIDEAANPLLVSVPVHKLGLIQEDKNQNIFLTLSQSRDEMRRNHSARHLSSLASSQDLNEPDSRKNSMRHVHSTPNLQSEQQNGSSHHHNHPHHMLHLPSVHVPPKALSYVTSIRHRLSNASSLFKYREESRAARISILVVIMFLISYLPYGLLVLLQSRLSNLFRDSTQIAIVMVLLANLSSPFIFAYRNKRVRRGVKRIFGLDPKARERQFLRGRGGFFRCGAKASIQVRRSVSKASTYSVNSCNKYLTPHAANNGTFLMDNEKCHYVKNNPPRALPSIDQEASFNGSAHITVATENERRSILKRVCDSSRKLGCASNSCTTSDNEQTDV